MSVLISEWLRKHVDVNRKILFYRNVLEHYLSQGSLFRKTARFAGQLVLQGISFRISFRSAALFARRLVSHQTRFDGQLVSHGSSFRRGTRFAGRLVLQGNSFCRETCFRKTSDIFILVVKQITFNIIASEMVSFYFLQKKLYMQTAINSKWVKL